MITLSKVLKATAIQAMPLSAWTEDRLVPAADAQAMTGTTGPEPASVFPGPTPELAVVATPAAAPESSGAITIDAASLLAAVRTEADAVLAAAHTEAVVLRQVAREEGYAAGRDEGYAEGHKAALEELEPMRQEALAQAADLRRQAEAERESLIAHAQDDLLAVAVTLAQRIVITELSLRPDVLTEMVADALRRLGPGSPAQIRVNPQDLPILESSKQPLHAGSKGPAGVQLVPDAALTRGEFLVQGSHGHVDGRLASQFAELEAFMQEAAEGKACQPTSEPFDK